ncbi:MAG: aldehyde ferredoxin oxidoreductase family protein [Desulfatiglandaceae bacterium]
MYGMNGVYLDVDLSSAEARRVEYDEGVYRAYLGGNGLGVKIIHDTVPVSADALGPENGIVFTVGPLTDTPLWGTSRGHVCGFSPLTGLFFDSNFGGKFAVTQKRTGFDAIVIRGRASEPVYLLVTEMGAEIKPAGSLWGKTTVETIQELERIEGPGASCVSIGPAGENKVLFANIIGGGKRYGAAGRGGLGAALGAKRLKAVVARGNRRTPAADRDLLAGVLKERFPTLRAATKPFSEYGTPFLVDIINGLGMLGTKNNSRETFQFASSLNGEMLRENYRVEDTACFGCPVGCGKNVRLKKNDLPGDPVKMPEYETLYSLGSMLENPDVEAVIAANHMCDLMGLDTISMGVTMAFVAECVEKGVAGVGELGGAVHFGCGDALPGLIEATALRKGVGVHLGKGSTRLAAAFGGDAYKYLYSVKGLEIAGHSARGLRGMSLAYPTSTRGGSHHDGRPKYDLNGEDPGFDGQPEYVVKNQYFTAVGDSLIVCRFIAERGIGTPLNEHMAVIAKAGTGFDISLGELEKIGERIYNLERMINVKRGVSRKDDALPYRVVHEPIPDGPAAGRFCPPEELDRMLDRFYSLRGWSKDGIPEEWKLRELGLD